jgi:hypothetical protein
MRKLLIYCCVMMSLIPLAVLAENRIYTELQYQDIWCNYNNGLQEVVLEDNTRCDCVTMKNVVEFDFADKWYEAIGQSLHYATQIDNIRPGIVLIIEKESDYRFVKRMNHVIKTYNLPIDIWTIDAKVVAEHIEKEGE